MPCQLACCLLAAAAVTVAAAGRRLAHAVLLGLGEGRARMAVPLLAGCELDAAFGLEAQLMEGAFEEADVTLEEIQRMTVFRADQGLHAATVMEPERDLDAPQLGRIQAQGEFRLLAADPVLEGEAELGSGRRWLLLAHHRLLRKAERAGRAVGCAMRGRQGKAGCGRIPGKRRKAFPGGSKT